MPYQMLACSSLTSERGLYTSSELHPSFLQPSVSFGQKLYKSAHYHRECAMRVAPLSYGAAKGPAGRQAGAPR